MSKRFVSLLVRLRELRPDIVDPEPLIREGRILVEGLPVTNAHARVPRRASLTISAPAPLKGERKLRIALRTFGVDVQGSNALDAGAATGGFTKALLEAGARRVYAVDTGHGQILGSLRQDPRVVVLERTNVGGLTLAIVPETVHVITLDLSYLSIARAVPQLNVLDIAPSAILVALVKPMFELGLRELPGPGVWPEAVARASEGVNASGWQVQSVVRSPIIGGRGAVEFLLHASRQ